MIRLFNRLPSRAPIARPFAFNGSPLCKYQAPFQFLSRRHTTVPKQKADVKLLEMGGFTPDKIRNFCIVAHIDHGKTTLSTKLLTMTNTIPDSHKNAMYLDKLQVEKERGITVKAQTCSIIYPHTDGTTYLINLIDTPGHVDFNYEVTRSLMACQGALLVVDASQGVQAQTLANFWLAFEQGLTIVPVMNKIDIGANMIPVVTQQIKDSFDAHPDDIIMISAKSGLGVDTVLPRVIDLIPPPVADSSKPLKALLFDNWFDGFRGVLCLVSIKEGTVKKGDKIVSAQFSKTYEVVEVGILHPENMPTDALYAGQVGYIFCGMKTTQEARVGDTFFLQGKPVEALPGFKAAKPMVYAGVYPIDSAEFDLLRDAVQKLTLNDASVPIEKESSIALGLGYRCGFLGMLHMDVFMQRLRQEYDAEVLATPPTVPYKVILRSGEEKIVSNPADYPDEEDIDYVQEPMVEAAIVVPNEYIGPIMTLCLDRRATPGPKTALGERVRMQFTIPLSEVILDFFDILKQLTSGYASFEYEEAGYQDAPLVKVHIMLNGENVDALSIIIHKDKAYSMGKRLVEKLKGVIDKQLFQVSIQAAIGSRVIARETVSAARKDVLAKCYGGDITRKRKLLDKQKEGKKKMKSIGNVEIPPEAFLEILKR